MSHRPALDVRFDLARPDDDAAIRRVLRTNPVPGGVVVSYEREPDYFLGCGTMGRSYQVVVGRNHPDGAIVGFVSRAIRPRLVNGRPEDVGYLSHLRVDKPFRGHWLVARGFRYMRHLHADGRVAGYLVTITEENVEARGILVDRPRRHFPAFREVDRLHTLALIVRAPKALPPSPYDIRRGSSEESGAVVAFLREHGAAKQFFPVYDVDDFGAGPTTRGFAAEDLFIARYNGKIVGVLGLWDQSEYKQTVVRAYSGAMRWGRPFYNACARMLGAHSLPPPGEHLRSAYASFICVAGNDPDLFHLLLRYVYNLAAERQYAFLIVGLSERDPLLAVARRYAHITYRSTLYTVCWEEGGSFHDRLDDRVAYVEVATL